MTSDAPTPLSFDWLETLTLEQLLDLAEHAAALARRKLAEDVAQRVGPQQPADD